MTATLTLAHRDEPVDVTDPATVRQIAGAVAAHNRGEGNRTFRLRQRHNLAIRFRASYVKALNSHGVDLVDLGSPFQQVEAVAA